MTDIKRLLLISNSTLYGSGYLDHAAAEIQDFLGPLRSILFVPYALHNQDGYASKARERFATMGYGLESIHEEADKLRAIDEADAIFVGGGNTFRLLKNLYDEELLSPIRARVTAGMPYIGSSAGSNVAAPTICTTNDMPIVEPPTFEALGLVTFQINPHYLDPLPDSTHMGETREERLLQFLEDNDTPVVGLREGALLRVEDGRTLLKGSTGARIFRKGEQPIEIAPGTFLDELVNPNAT
ncbi:MAG TPA: dipeptidase PepE [Pyrinomonadaceae bacterium]|nr:dipeptidase PepE [Pyrinomonadaceae bacterium]